MDRVCGSSIFWVPGIVRVFATGNGVLSSKKSGFDFGFGFGFALGSNMIRRGRGWTAGGVCMDSLALDMIFKFMDLKAHDRSD